MFKIIFQIVPVVAWFAAVVVAVRPLRLPRLHALVASAALGLAFGKFAFFELVGGDGFTPDLPAGAIWAYGWIYGAAMLFMLFSSAALLLDAAALALRRPVPLHAKRVRGVALAACAAAMSLYGIWEGVREPTVRRVEVECPGLPAAFDGYRIVHLSDLHCSPAARRPRFEAIVAKVNALKPDLVAITGDFVDGRVSDRRYDLAPLADLRAADGVLGCTGNHEAYWDWSGWRAVLVGFGIVFPEDSGTVVIRRGSDGIAVGGVIDPSFHVRGRVRGPSVAASAFAGVGDGVFRILLYHHPYTERIGSAEADVRLQLSGHTHGGAMPILRTLVERVNEGRSRGLYEFAPGRHIHISPGTGQWAGFPLRLFNPAEISELVLRRAGQGA